MECAALIVSILALVVASMAFIMSNDILKDIDKLWDAHLRRKKLDDYFNPNSFKTNLLNEKDIYKK